MADDEKLESIHGEPSFRISTDEVALYVTKRGGHMAPVEFCLGGRTVSPYSLAPWRPDEISEDLPALLKVLRGDFFCLPFGANPYGPPHGDVANAEWRLAENTGSTLHLTMDPEDIGGHVEKRVSLRAGETVVYQEHRVSGLEGRFNYGNHPILDFGEARGRITTSPFRFGSVNDGVFSNPENREYGILEQSARFADLKSVPLATGGTTDLTLYPARRGFEDLIMLSARENVLLGWTAVVMDGFVWYSLKDPQVFPSTLFWITNGGRHAEPWNGRHVNRIGFEEVCSHFADNVETAREDRLAAEGIPTTAAFLKDEEKSFRIAQGVVAVADDFGEVVSINGVPGEKKIAIAGSGGATVEAAVDWEFVMNGDGM